ncbi:MAG TPA: hypothetical protein ENK94_03410 [Campylobacterales bacterium]|nr:hypothetical protein [Campylobacterales bacterium]
MLKMIFWLIAAMALGFMVAWLLSKIRYQNRQQRFADESASVLVERNNLIDKLEKKIEEDSVRYKKVCNQLKNVQDDLSEKNTSLHSIQGKLNNVSNSVHETEALKRQNNLLNLEIDRLKALDMKRLEELKEFEKVLVRADSKLVENEKNAQQIIKSLDEQLDSLTCQNEAQAFKLLEYEKSLAALKEELKLYESDHNDPEFVISKDQFLKIEEQLKVYQEEISKLQNEKSELVLKIEKSCKEPSNELVVVEDKSVPNAKKSSDDSSMVRVFRDTYKKITKS